MTILSAQNSLELVHSQERGHGLSAVSKFDPSRALLHLTHAHIQEKVTIVLNLTGGRQVMKVETMLCWGKLTNQKECGRCQTDSDKSSISVWRQEV